MNIISGIVVFMIIWWVLFFPILSMGNHVPDQHEPGCADSAPENPRITLKMTITTILTIILWFLAFYFIESDLYTFRN